MQKPGLQIAEHIDQLIFLRLHIGAHPDKGSTEEKQLQEAKLKLAAVIDTAAEASEST